MEKQFRTVNLASLLTATILFLLPWTNVTCGSQHVASQSGLQAAYGGLSASADSDPNQMTRANVHDSDLPASALVAIALAAVLAGAAIALLMVMKRPAPKIAPGVFALIAFGLLGLTAGIGFPIDEITKAAKAPDASKGSLVDQAVTGAWQNTIAVQRTPWFWLELVALAIPAALYLNRRFTATPVPPPAAPGAPPS